jgi:hypothetical protein
VVTPAEGTGPDPGTGSGAVEALRRWEDLGATWRVLARRGGSVTISLCRCDGGEEADRLTSDDAGLLAYVSGRESSEDPPAPTA